MRTNCTGAFALILAVVLAAFLPACSSLDDANSKLPIQYATLKLIEQSELTGNDVLTHVAAVRGAIAEDPSVTLQALIQEAGRAALMAGLSPADQLALNYLLGLIQVSLDDLNLIDETQRLQAVTVLDWVEQAARMSPDA